MGAILVEVSRTKGQTAYVSRSRAVAYWAVKYPQTTESRAAPIEIVQDIEDLESGYMSPGFPRLSVNHSMHSVIDLRRGRVTYLARGHNGLHCALHGTDLLAEGRKVPLSYKTLVTEIVAGMKATLKQAGLDLV